MPSAAAIAMVAPDLDEAAAVTAGNSPGPIWLNAQASPPRAAASMAAPVTSNWRGSCRSSGATASRMPTATSANGGLIQNTDCQPNVSVSQPPSTGPPTVVRADAAAHTPIARLRSSRG